MAAVRRLWALVGCALAGVLCLRDAGYTIESVWSAPPWLNILLAIVFIMAGLRIMAHGTEQ